jgi:hypothetical protein
MKPIYILVSLLLFSCGARKVDINKTDIKKDSITETKSIVKTIENKQKIDSTNLSTISDNTEITITPIDSSKTILVDGKTYKNVILKYKKNKTNSLYINNKKESSTTQKDSLRTTNTNTSERTFIKTKSIDKKISYYWIIWLVILIITLYITWRNRRLLL